MRILSFHILHWEKADDMVQKVFVLLCSMALVRAGVIGTHYSPAASVSTVYSSVNNAPVTATIGNPIYQKTYADFNYASPAPVYESLVSTQESNTKDLYGSQQTTFAKSLDTPFSSVQKYDSRITNNGILSHSAPTVYSSPVHASYLYSPGAYSVTSPFANSVTTKTASPITYTTHSAPIVAKYSSPIVTKTITPVATYASHEGQVAKTTITYSEAPLVSHMTFTGLGTSYAW